MALVRRAGQFVIASVITLPLALAITRPNPKEIIRRSVAANEANWKIAPHLVFTDHDVETKRGGNRSDKTVRVYMIDGSPYKKLLAVNGQPLSAQQEAAEKTKMQREIRRRGRESASARASRVAEYQKERTRDHAMMKEMGQAFVYKLRGEQKLNGHDVYVMDATPKPGYQPKTRETKVLTGMKGTLWIDKETYQWVKVEAEVVQPVNFFGFIAKVGPGTRFMLQQEPVGPDQNWMPTRFSMKVNATVLGIFNEDSTDDETFTDYQPMNKSNLTAELSE